MIVRALKRALAATGQTSIGRSIALGAIGSAVRALPPGTARDRLIGPVTSYLLPAGFRRVVTLGDGTRLHGTARDILTRTVLYFGDCREHCWEPETTRLAMALAARGHVVIGGGHVGYFAIPLARAAGGSNRLVVAFEPLPSVAREFEANAALNRAPNLRLEHAALGATSGTMTLYEQGIRSSLLAPQKGEAVARHTVRVVALDDYLSSGAMQGPLGLLLLDVEGVERAVLEGAAHLLARPDAPDILFEVVGGLAARADSAEAYLRAQGFSLFVVLDDYALRLHTLDPSRPIPLRPLDAYRGSERYVNVVATRRPAGLEAAGAHFV